MALAKKCDRCGKLYENYDDIECNDVQVNRIDTIGYRPGERSISKSYDLCPDCCFDFARWLVDPETIVIKNDLEDGIDKFNKVDTTLYADGRAIMTAKANGEVEWLNQLNVDGAEINPDYILDNIVLENKEEIENGEC